MAARWKVAAETKLRRAWFKKPKPIPQHGWAKQYRDALRSVQRGAVADVKLKELEEKLSRPYISASEELELVNQISFLLKYANSLRTVGATKPMRERVETIHRVWQGERSQGIETFNSVRVRGSKIVVTDMFWSGNTFFFIEKNNLHGYARKSQTFNNRERALRALNTKTIQWMEFTDLA